MPTVLANIYRLGVKELWSLVRDPMMLVLIANTFALSIYVAATAMPESVVWPQFLAIPAIGSVLFFASLARFRKTINEMA